MGQGRAGCDQGLGTTLATLKYYVETIGTQPDSGFPLYIALHGGGGVGRSTATNVKKNGEEWEGMTRYYKGRIANGIYVALRGVGDSWDLHFTPTGYVLIERLIENMILFENVDANKVYLIGFSAGGDGVFRLSNRLAQRFAASNMRGGDPGDVDAMNILNSPLCLQVGEQDVGLGAYGRSTHVAEYEMTLDSLKKTYGDLLPTPVDPGYIHDVFIHPTGVWSESTTDYGLKHNSWEKINFDCSPKEMVGTPVEVIDDYGKWYVDYGKAPKDTVNAKMARKLVNTNAIDWLTKYNRNPVPSTVVWNLGIGDSNDNFRYVKNLSAKSRNYWLDIGVDNYPTTSKTVVQSRLDKTKNKIQVLDAKKYLRILLRDGMLDLSKSISVEIGGQTLNINVGIAENATVINGTLVRNDPNLVFTADIILIQGAGGWTATTSQRPA